MTKTRPAAMSPTRNDLPPGRSFHAAPFVFSGDMKARPFSDLFRLAVFSAFLFILSACAPTVTPTPFLPPTESVELLVPITRTPTTDSPTTVPTIAVPTPTPPCTDNLTWQQDLTIPDGTSVSPGQSLDKQWLVTNSGTCNWDARYRLKHVGGDALGVAEQMALYPARAGAQVTLEIVFTAPQDPGTYQSAWQAVAPDGTPFGDGVYIQITVNP